MPVKPAINPCVNTAAWLSLLLFSFSSAAAFGQRSPGSRQASHQVESSVAQASQPLQADPDRSADFRSAFSSTPVSRDYRIGVDDILTVSVWHEQDLSRNVTVRPDGKISLPLVGEVQAAGRTPPQLEAQLRSGLAQFIKDPELTVIVDQIRSRRVNIIGQVVHPGTFAITQQMGVLDIIAEAGGLKDFAKQKKIYVLRETSAGQRIRLDYNYRDVLGGRHNAQDILLQANDTVVVP